MTKHTPNLDQYFDDQANAKISLVTANILDGIKSRLKDRGTITPKQAQWLVERIAKSQSISDAFAEEIMSVLEKGTLKDQKTAEQTVKTVLVDKKIDDKAQHFDSLFVTETKQLVSELDALTTRFKNKVGL
jgi:hypothetical protein